MNASNPRPLADSLRGALERLDDLIDWERRDRRDLERTLAPVRCLLRAVGNPHRDFKAVHVAGTKGKSSTATWIAFGLGAAGHRVGLYTSPHVVRVTERVQIEGRDVDDEVLAQALNDVLDARAAAEDDALHATYFDVLTAAAFLCYSRCGLDWAVVECGLGGRLDSTNALRAELCVVTNIDLEHTEVLGDTRARIAFEKIGILDEGAALVTGPIDDEIGPVYREATERLSVADHVIVEACPTLREQNVAVAGAALDLLGRRGERASDGTALSAELVAGPLPALPGRLEVLSACGREVVLDGAHVASSVRRVLRELEIGSETVCILALRSDKDAESVLKALSGHVDRVICTSLDSAPFRPASELEAVAQRIGMTASAVEDPGEALARALELAGDGGRVLAIGSLYLAGALRPELDA